MSNPFITIILTTYNRAHLIGVTLDSIVNQTYKNWECLIIDDNSEDNTSTIINKYLKKDKRFNFIVKPKSNKKGLPVSSNIGLEKAKGYYFIFFDDDIIHPNNLEYCISIFKENNVDFCHYAKKPFIDGELPIIEKTDVNIIRNISKEDIAEIVTNKIGLASCTVMWKSNYFNEDLL